MTARGIRLNNPGNIRISDTPWRGKASPSSDAEFEEFSLPYYGLRALAKILISYMTLRGANTVRKIISRYAPSSENDTDAYAVHVAKMVRVGLDDRLPPDAETLVKLVAAIILHENGTQPYDPLSIRVAVLGALGKMQQ